MANKYSRSNSSGKAAERKAWNSMKSREEGSTTARR